jgi:adenylate cyclase
LADQQGTAQAAAVARLASALIDAVLEAVEGSGGALVSASSSAGGLDLLALFGAPIAHEHDGLSAVRAALELQAHLGGLRAREAALPLAFVGLEAGVAAAGLIGTPDRFVYAITGEVAADSATQLEWAAQLGELTVAGPVLCERLGDLLIVEERGAEAGEAAPARLLRGLRGSVSPRQPRCGALVGRERELRQIAAALDALRAGRRRVLVLQGEAGVGKSRLTQELIARAGAEASCLVTEAQGRAPTSYSLFRELLRMLCGLPQEASPTLVFRRLYSTLERLTPAREAELWPALGGLLGLPTADQGFAAQHSATRQRALAAATVALLEAAARRQPLIWICEDLHEADTASLALLEQVLSLLGEVPLLFCATLRPHPVARELDRHPAHATVAATVRSLGAAAAVLQIEPLGGADRARLLDALLPELPAMLRDTLSEQSGGNPLFLELLAESLGQRADTLAANGRSAHVVGRSLPPTLRQLIAAQIDLLPVEVRQFAHVAAVIATVDRVFPHWLLERVTDRPQSTDPRLAELLRARVIEQVPGQPARHYRFRHGLVQSAIYERLLAGERDALHRRIGLVLHYLEPEQREARLDALAYHCYEGKLPELALAYSLRAGRRAQQTYANREARQAFRRALGLARRLGALQQEADAREGLGELYALQGELSPARAQFERALRLGAALDADDAQVEAQARRRRLLSLVSEQAGDYAEAEAHCRNGLVLAASLATPSTETARLYAQLAGVLWRRADYAAADRACREGLAALPPAPAALSERVLLLQRQATIAGERGNFGEAVEELEQSLGLARLAADPAPLGAVLHNLGMYLDATGDVTRALACYRESLAIKERIGDAPGRVLTVGNLGVLYLKAGDYAAAERCFVEARDISQRLGLHGPHADAMVNLGHLELMVGKLHEAGGHFEAARAIFAALDDAGSVAHCLYMLGDVALNQAQAQRASQYAEQSLALARQIQSLALEACALRVLGEASLDQGRLDSAAAQLETAWQIQERLGEPYDQAMVLAARARLALARHDRVLAQDLARRALALARAQSIPFLISRLEALQTLAARAV